MVACIGASGLKSASSSLTNTPTASPVAGARVLPGNPLGNPVSAHPPQLSVPPGAANALAAPGSVMGPPPPMPTAVPPLVLPPAGLPRAPPPAAAVATGGLPGPPGASLNLSMAPPSLPPSVPTLQLPATSSGLTMPQVRLSCQLERVPFLVRSDL